MPNAETLARELEGRGYNCSAGQRADGTVCIIAGGPNGDIDPPGEVHFLVARHPRDGRIEWNDAGGRLHSETPEISEVALAEAVIASIELINPA
jgi:hypothetical protein